MVPPEGLAELEAPEPSVAGEWSFEPDGGRARALTAEIDRRLISSLRYLQSEVGEAVGWDPDAFESWLRRIESGPRIDPLVHVLFHSLVEQIQAGEIGHARSTAGRLLQTPAGKSSFAVLTIDPDPAGARPTDLFTRFVDIEEDNRLDMVPPAPDEVARALQMIEQAMMLIGQNDPELEEELRGFVSEILLFDQGDEHLLVSAAVSCFQNWGSLLVRPTFLRDALETVDLLAHESTHMLLFALALDEPLLTNPPTERHFSPLRDAPRTMDGVFHATIVCARVARALVRQALASKATDELREIALARARYSLNVFDESVPIVEGAAKLTPSGRAVFEASKEAVERLRPAIEGA